MQLTASVDDPTINPGAGIDGEKLDGDNLEEENKRVIAKLTRNIIPFLWAINLFSFLLRVCVVNMHVVLTKDLNLSEYEYGGTLGAFYLAFVVFPIPANLILERMRMSVWISLLVCMWGCITLLTVFATDATSLIAFRFCLGITEAGLSPDITTWFGERFRVRQLSLLQTAIPCAYAAGAFVSPLILLALVNIYSLTLNFDVEFIITGAPSLVLSIVFYFCLPNSPSEARFLTDRDRKVLVYSRAIAASVWTHSAANRTSRSLFWSTVLNSKNWMLAFCGMFAMGTITGVNGFVPAILYEAGSSLVMSNRLIAIPTGLSVFVMLFWSYHSAEKHERFWHAFSALFVGLIALGACTVFVFLIDLSLVVVLLCIYLCAINSGYVVFIAEMVNSVLGSTSIGIGLFYSVVGFGGWFGPFLMGYMRDLTGDNVVGLAIMSASLGISIALLSIIHVTQRTTQIEVGSQMKLQYDSTTEQIEGSNKYAPNKDETGGAAILV